jgi:CubicO group peptidase (beta-lactamase class C family)
MKNVLIALSLLITGFTITYSQTGETLEMKIDKLFMEYDQPNTPGAAVLIAKAGEVLYKKGFGYANLEENIPVTPTTYFRLASVSKQFTAACVLKLIESGKLKLTTTLTELFKDFPSYGSEIKIEHLLNHTSGLIDYEDLIPDTTTIQVKDIDVLNMMKTQTKTYFEPGTEYKYSNSAYALLALIVENLSGKRFASFLHDNIFEPLEMNGTVAFEDGISTVPNRAFGYSKKDDGFMRTDQSITSAVLGDGGIYSSIEDLMKWEASLFTEKVLKAEMIEKATTRKPFKNGKMNDYGYGWLLKKHGDKEVVYHTGDTRGFRTILYRIPSERILIIVLINRNEGEMEELAEKVLEQSGLLRK